MGSCKKDNDSELPVIELITPNNCDSILQGDFIKLKVSFTDNDELARYAVDIHNNFNHDSYGPSDQGCNYDADKTPFNPYKYAVLEEIPAGLNSYNAEINIIIPEATDTGDYLMVIYAQDKTGLQSRYSISLKFYNNDRE